MYRHSFLIDEIIDRDEIELFGGKEIVGIDKIDSKIIQLMSPNARIPTIELAKKLKLTTNTVKNRINHLEKEGVIKGFRTDIDVTKFGYKWYKVDVNLKKYSKLPQIINYLKRNSHFVCIDKTLGYINLELEFVLKKVEDAHLIMEDISKKFPDTIKDYKYVSVVYPHKYRYISQ